VVAILLNLHAAAAREQYVRFACDQRASSTAGSTCRTLFCMQMHSCLCDHWQNLWHSLLYVLQVVSGSAAVSVGFWPVAKSVLLFLGVPLVAGAFGDPLKGG
jgi:ACR3 family arsenite efflux pump ArsB